MKRTMSRYIAILAATMIATVTACSYVVDMVERSITKRASFSITATYVKGSGVTISWDESGGGNFAGYEIYMTEEPDDEYSGYIIIGGPYSTIETYSIAPYYRVDSSLTSSSTQSFIFQNPELSNLLSAPQLGPGRYFFRVGIIDWDENPDKRTVENGYVYQVPEQDYPANTDISEISGLAAVDLY